MTLPIEQNGALQAADGTQLYYRQWRHPQPRGAVVMVHGLGEHSGRYTQLALLFYEAGLSVRMHDQRGHGHSGGARGSLRHSDDYLADLKLIVDDFSRHTQQVPFLFGHSMGGLVATRFACSGVAELRGLLLSSPALAIRLSGFQRRLLALSTCIAPGLALPTGLPAQKVSHDEQIVQAARSDTLNHGRVSARVINFMLTSMAQVQAQASSFRLPLLMQVAGDDAFVDPEGSRAFFAQVPDIDKSFCYYQDAYHEIFNESPAYRWPAQQDLKSWLVAHMK